MAPTATNFAVGHIPNIHNSPAPGGLSINNYSSRNTEEDRVKNNNADNVTTIDELATVAPPAKRPRGRPAGSKNKPRMPTYLSVDPKDALRSHVMEVSPGADVASCLAAYARARGRGVAVLHASGSVSGVTLRHGPEDSSSTLNPLFLIKGKLDIISLSGTVLPDNPSVGQSGLTVFVSGPGGQVLGGPVEGRLVAEGTVILVAATFSTATYEKLPFLGPPGEDQESRDLGPGQDPGSSGYDQSGCDDNMNMGGVGNRAVRGGQEASYAWFVPQQHQQSNGRPLYLNN